MEKENLYIIMPAYNEEKNITNVIEEWHPIVEKIGSGSKLVIIDDGSKDSTYEKICELKEKYSCIEAITKPNSGHGATVLFGYKYALEKGADYIFQTDSDGQTLASEFWEFWNKRHNHSAIIGNRNHRKDGLSRIFVTKVLKLVLWCIFGLKVTDANTPYRLMNRNVLEKYINKIPDGFNLANVLLTVLLINNHEEVLFIPITFKPRQGGVNSINFKKIIKIGKQAIWDFKNIKRSMN